MPLEGCDASLGMRWFHQAKRMEDILKYKIAFNYKRKTLILDVKFKGEPIAALARSSVI